MSASQPHARNIFYPTVVSVKKGILRCALVTESSETFQTAEIDQLGLLANLQALVGLSTDISEYLFNCSSGDEVSSLLSAL